jgi:hypothetical protein
MSMNCVKNIVFTLITLTLLSACDPSEKNKTENVEAQRIQCLNKICVGDVVPKTTSENSIAKIDGRYFSVPKAYHQGFTGLTFYWPSKTPLTGLVDKGDFSEKGQPFNDRAIELFIAHESSSVELSDLIAAAINAGRPFMRKKLSDILDIGTVQVRDHPKEQSTIYIATQTAFPSGKPAVAGCRHTQPDDRCSAYFVWDKGLSITVRFNQRHAKDWPQIYVEIMRVLSLVKPL